MDNELKRILELSGIKESDGSPSNISYGSKNDPSIKRQDGATLMINTDGEDEWVNSEYEEDAINAGYHYSNDDGAEMYDNNKRDYANSQTASMMGEDVESTQSGIAVKVESIMIGVVSKFPPEGDADVKLDMENVDNPKIDVRFKGNIGIPVMSTTTITRHNASYYGPEEDDEFENESIVDAPISIYTEMDPKFGHIISLYDEENYDQISWAKVTDDNTMIINQFVADVNKYMVKSKQPADKYYSSYKQAHNANYNGPD